LPHEGRVNVRRPVIFLGICIVSLLILFEGLATAPEERWQEVTRRESRAIEDGRPVPKPDVAPAAVDATDREKIRSAAQAQWNLAEWHYMRGEYDDAKREYERLIDEFPYIELDYGYRTDDARKRLRSIARMKGEPATR
jgi:hypothetical protein